MQNVDFLMTWLILEIGKVGISEKEIWWCLMIRDIFAYFFIKTYVVGAHYIKVILMSIHNIGFYEDLTKITF